MKLSTHLSTAALNSIANYNMNMSAVENDKQQYVVAVFDDTCEAIADEVAAMINERLDKLEPPSNQ